MENKPAEKAALPIITFEHDVTVHLNGEDIRALHFPAGHTDGDSIIFFPKNNVVHMGDDFVRYGFPFIDVTSGGSVQDRKSTRLNSSHLVISYAVFCLKKKKTSRSVY